MKMSEKASNYPKKNIDLPFKTTLSKKTTKSGALKINKAK